MIEAEWLVGIDPREMLEQIAGQVSSRKLRLFACGCCRRYWSQLTNPHARQLLEQTERVAEGRTRPRTLEPLLLALQQAMYEESYFHQPLYEACIQAGAPDIHGSIRGVLGSLELLAIREAVYGSIPGENERAITLAAVDQERRGQAIILRELVPSPFRRIEIDPTWLHWDADCMLNMARGIQRGARFDELPILADALEEAGCSSRVLLEHLRLAQNGAGRLSASCHLRGCWALDLLLGHR